MQPIYLDSSLRKENYIGEGRKVMCKCNTVLALVSSQNIISSSANLVPDSEAPTGKLKKLI